MSNSSILRFSLVLVAALLVLCFQERRWRVISDFRREKSTALNLAVARIVILCVILHAINLHQELVFSELDSALLYPPRGWAAFARLIPRSPHLARSVYVVFVVAAVCGIIGLLTRFSCGVTCLASFYLLTLPQLFGKVNHSHFLVAFCFLLALSPSGDALSIDELWRAIRRSDKGMFRRAPSRSYAAYLQSMMLLIGCIYFFPGAWKLSVGWLRWFSSENMYLLIVMKLYELGGGNSLQRSVLRMPQLLAAGACFTLAFELGFTFFILSRRTRLLGAAAGLMFHNLTTLLMGISFAELQCCYVIFVDWTAALIWLNRQLRIEPLTVLYHPGRQHSRYITSVLVSWDWASQTMSIPSTPIEELAGSAWQKLEHFPSCLPFLVIDSKGSLLNGWFAFRQIATRIPLLWPIRAIMSLPGLERLGWRICRHFTEIADKPVAAAPMVLEHSETTAYRKLASVVRNVLLGLFFVAGALRSVNTWPIACFPTFDSPPEAVLQKLSMQSEEPNGVVQDETLSFDPKMGALLGPERWQGLTSQFSDRLFRPAAAKALLQLWQNNHMTTPVKSATFCDDRYRINLSTGEQTLLSRKRLGIVGPRSGSTQAPAE